VIRASDAPRFDDGQLLAWAALESGQSILAR
jgi:hypothetical protein